MTPVRAAVGMVVVVVIVVMMIVAAAGSMHMWRGADVLVIAMAMMRIAVVGMIMVSMIMTMVMPVTMTVIMPMIGMVVGVIVAVNRRGGDIGAALGIERRLDGDDAGPEPARHILDHMIAPDAQAFLHQFGRQMAIAEMPGDPDQGGGIGAPNFGQWFGGGDDFDDAPVVERQTVAGPQHHGVRQVEQEGEAAHSGHRHATAVAVVIIENDRVSRFPGPGAGGTNGMSVLHGGRSPKEAASRAAFEPSHTRLGRFRKASCGGRVRERT
jgi:hypothetical protein